ncbi:MAG: hypothetical protein ABJC26_06485 [Gemmatimonadaceae bacterium]
MSFDTKRLFELLPSVYRLRDGEAVGDSKDVLRALIDVIGSQVAVLEEDIEQLYDDQFIETCAPWVAPYIGDLIGYRTLYGLTEKIGSPRAEVANTIAFRRRKGTASMLEQLARDVTGWNARIVEFFQLLSTTQYMNHIRPQNTAWVNMRKSANLARIGTAFDTAAHTADVRRIARRRGRFNIPNVGLYLWRINECELAASPAVKLVAAASDRRYLFSPTGSNAPLFNHAVADDTIAHIAERTNVSQPITRRELWDNIGAFIGDSIAIRFGNTTLPASAVSASDLSDFGSGWAYTPTTTVLIDPVLGRLSLPATLSVDGNAVDMKNPVVTFHYGFPADMGGGSYARTKTFNEALTPVTTVSSPQSIASALATLAPTGAVEIKDNGRYTDALAISAPHGAHIELRAADGRRPAIALGAELVIDLKDDADVTLNGLLLLGATIRVPATAKRGTLRIKHCTLVPGITLNVDGTPKQPTLPSIVIESDLVTLEIDHSIVGGIRAHADANVSVTSSIVDATDPTAVAYAALDGISAGGEISIVNSTVTGKVHSRVLRLVSNSILNARLAVADTWLFPVQSDRRQDGCVRFSFIPLGSRTPRRYRCQPTNADDALRVQPQFTSERYGDPAYCQLSDRCAIEIRTGADDESVMGAFHDVFAPQRETNLGIRLDEYLRFGLEAGVFHAS